MRLMLHNWLPWRHVTCFSKCPPKNNVEPKLKVHCSGLKNSNNCSKIVHRDHHRNLIKSLGFGSILSGQDKGFRVNFFLKSSRIIFISYCVTPLSSRTLTNIDPERELVQRVSRRPHYRWKVKSYKTYIRT